MQGCVIWHVENIITQDKHNVWLVFSKRFGDKIEDRTDGLPLPAAITGVADNKNDTGKTYAREYPNDREDIACKYRN